MSQDLLQLLFFCHEFRLHVLLLEMLVLLFAREHELWLHREILSSRDRVEGRQNILLVISMNSRQRGRIKSSLSTRSCPNSKLVQSHLSAFRRSSSPRRSHHGSWLIRRTVHQAFYFLFIRRSNHIIFLVVKSLRRSRCFSIILHQGFSHSGVFFFVKSSLEGEHLLFCHIF